MDNLLTIELGRAHPCIGKECTKCKVFRKPDEYGKASHHKDGLKSSCKFCDRAWHSANFQKNPKVRERNERWIKNNPEKRKAWAKKDREKNPEKWRGIRLKHSFGISLDHYNEMFQKQNGCCAICKRHQNEIKKTLCVDHNHLTGRIRKLLCINCNHAIGLIRENLETAKAVVLYLEEDQK